MYIDAPDEKTARARGALVNIAEGRGTSVDAAKFMRDMVSASLFLLASSDHEVCGLDESSGEKDPDPITRRSRQAAALNCSGPPQSRCTARKEPPC